MKLCPQCQFIYEDDQSLCDMDGEALVYDNRLGVFPGILPAVTGRGPAKPRLRFRVVSTIAALVFPALLCLAYYASSPLWDSKPRSRSLGVETSETSPLPQTAPLQDNFSSPAANPSQSPTNPKAAPESGSVSSDELPETPAQQSARAHIVAKPTDGMKTNDNSLGISEPLPPLPRLTPLPRLASPRRLPAAKPEEKQPRSTTTPRKQALTNQKSAIARRTASIVEVKPASTRSRVSGFLKKTGRILKKPFQM